MHWLRRPSPRTTLALAIACFVAVLLPVGGRADEPSRRLIDQEPYDEIVLRNPPDEVLKLMPIDLVGRRLPSDPKPTDKLTVRLWDQPNNRFEVQWKDIAEVRLFEQMVLAEAEEHVAAGRYAQAYDDFEFLEQRYPSLPGLSEAMERFLFAEASSSLEAGETDLALISLYALYDRNPKFEGLQEALGTAFDRQVQQQVDQGDLAGARKLLAELGRRYTDDPTAAKWHEQFQAQADALVTAAEEHAAAERLREAQEACHEALIIWPAHQRGRSLLVETFAKHPMVKVGVIRLNSATSGPLLADWAARRTGRLTERHLFEPMGFGLEGGQYACPWGETSRHDLGRKLVIDLRRDATQIPGERPLTGYEISRELRLLVDAASPDYNADLAELVGSVAVSGVFGVELELRRAHVLPEALLRSVVPLKAMPHQADDVPAALGPFRALDSQDDEQSYQQVAPGDDDAQGAPREIVEQRFGGSDDAIAALLRGDIGVIDRVMPWRIGELAERPEVRIGQYAAPTLHCLIPTRVDGPLANRALRRAILYALPRQAILRDRLGGGTTPEGSQVVSGPFVRGYAYNDDIEPRALDRHLALTLTEIAMRQLDPHTAAADEQSAGSSAETPVAAASKAPPAPLPTLVLAHEPGELQRIACRAIAEQLQRIGIAVELREVIPTELWANPEAFDLVYAELAMWEPLIDAERLLGAGGPASDTSPYLQAALRRLDAAPDWPSAREALHDVHRLVHEELPILPLWQLTERYAHRIGVDGVGTRPVTLYQDVDRWNVAALLPSEVP